MSAVHPETILVTGADGQLGREIRSIASEFPQYKFLFTSRNQLSITDENTVEEFFKNNVVNFCVNCAAYTNVDKAESEREVAFLVNATAAGHLASACNSHDAKLIHISTDYVYDGNKREPLKEADKVMPLNVYGWSKLEGEKLVMENHPESIIIRTSWVYSFYGHNFVKTMMRLLTEKRELNVVADQTGCPTYAADLARVILFFITEHSGGNQVSGIFNYSNSGITTWFQFAQFIRKQIGSTCELHPVETVQYPTPAMRPKYSVLDTSKIKSALSIEIPFWEESVAKCIQLLLLKRSS